MGLIVNGTTIPTNVANALLVNGISVTSVMCNGINAWLQSLVSLSSWVGSSLTWDWRGTEGIETSGLYFRRWWDNTAVTPWAYINPTSGIMSGGGAGSNGGPGLYLSGSSFTFGTGWLTFSPTTKTWSGGTSYNNGLVFENVSVWGNGIYYYVDGFSVGEGNWIYVV